MSKHILTIQILHSKNFVPRYFLLFLSKAENTLVEAGYLRRHILVLHAIGSTGDIETFCHSYFPSLNKFEFKRNKTSPSQGLSSSREAWGRGWQGKRIVWLSKMVKLNSVRLNIILYIIRNINRQYVDCLSSSNLQENNFWVSNMAQTRNPQDECPHIWSGESGSFHMHFVKQLFSYVKWS